MRRRYAWEAAFLLVTVGWGATFVTVKDAVEIAPPLLFMAFRFSIGAALLALVRPRALVRLDRAGLGAGLFAGLFLFGGYALQTIGLQRTTASNAGFITGLFVVLVPLFGALWLRTLPSRASIAGALLATAGLAFLSRPDAGGLGAGDALILGTAACFAIQILIVGRFANRVDPIAFATVQLAVVGVASALGSLVAEPFEGAGSGTVWIAVAITVLAATSVSFWIQAAGQRVVPPTRAAVIFTGEPVFAAIFGVLIQDDPLTALGVLGGALILGGMLVAELFAPDREAV